MLGGGVTILWEWGYTQETAEIGWRPPQADSFGVAGKQRFRPPRLPERLIQWTDIARELAEQY